MNTILNDMIDHFFLLLYKVIVFHTVYVYSKNDSLIMKMVLLLYKHVEIT